jgi:AAA+ ATPase superfamily predicted ATPase
VYLGYGDLDAKYNLFKRYFLAIKFALSEINPHSSLKEEENQKVLDQYLKWLDDIYKEIKLKIPPPELTREEESDLNYGIAGYMGPAEYAFGFYEVDPGQKG